MKVKPSLSAIITFLLFPGLAAASSDQLRRCDVSVGADFEFSGMCVIRHRDYTDVVYLLSAEVVARLRPEYFFYLPKAEGEPASWNSEPFASDAHDFIGTFDLTNDCYIGEQFKICSSSLWE